jgi:sporulation protein YabP
MEKIASSEHTLSLMNRKNMSVSGVLDVTEFSDTHVVLKTSMGGLLIKGRGLSVNQLNTQTGTLDVNGEIQVIQYMNKGKDGFLAGLFK